MTNQPDSYGYGYGSLGFSYFGFATNPPFEGNFYQSIDVYINAGWPTASANNNGQAFWIDMQPSNPDGNNSGAEHNFRITPTGSGVQVSVDGQSSPIATLTTSGWYDFEMTYEAGAPTDLVTTNMDVYSLAGALQGTTTVYSDSPSTDGPLLSENLQGPGYVWLRPCSAGRLACSDARHRQCGVGSAAWVNAGTGQFHIDWHGVNACGVSPVAARGYNAVRELSRWLEKSA